MVILKVVDIQASQSFTIAWSREADSLVTRKIHAMLPGYKRDFSGNGLQTLYYDAGKNLRFVLEKSRTDQQ